MLMVSVQTYRVGLHQIYRFEDVLHNLDGHGREFAEKNEGIVVEMTRKFLEYVKSARVEAEDAQNDIRTRTDSEKLEIRMTPDGFPILTEGVMDKELKKVEWETLLRKYLSQHYCEYHLNRTKLFQC